MNTPTRVINIPLSMGYMRAEQNMFYLLYNKDNNYDEIKLNLIPDTVSYSYSPNFVSNSTLGRVSPILLYTGGSDETYSFSITLHEDLHVSNGQKLVELVDKFKSLSYPRPNADGTSSLPLIYFSIGEIMGTGLINTSVEWVKPFRDGYYIMAKLNITITVAKKFQLPEVNVASLEQGQGIVGVEYTDNVVITGNAETTSNLLGMLSNELADVILSENSNADLVTYNDSEAYEARRAELALNEWITAQERLLNMYGTLTDGLDDTAFISGPMTVGGIRYALERGYGTFDADKILALEDVFRKVIENYYENINLDLLRSEKEALIEEAVKILLNMLAIAEELNGYGKGN